MRAPTGRWTIQDDLAFRLCPDDLANGHAQIRDALTEGEAWLDHRMRWLHSARWTAAASFVASGAALLASQFGLWPAAWTSGPLAAFSALVWGLCEAAPVWVQSSIFDWGARFPLNARRLAPLREYLAAAAASSAPLHDLEGNVVAPEFLLNPWAVLLFSEREEIRRLPTVGAQGLRRVRYGKLLLAEMPTALALPGATPPDTNRKASPVTIVIDRSVTNIDQRRQRLTLEQRNTNVQTTNHFEFVTRISAQATDMARSPINGEIDASDGVLSVVRWPCVFEENDFQIRLKIFSGKVLRGMAKVQPHQIEKYVIAVVSARRIWMANPHEDITDLAEAIGKLVKANSDGWTGLRKSDSTAWIKALIGGTGNYAFVKEVFNAISYDPAGHDDAQYRLILQ